MKFKFAPEVQKIIDTVATLPDEASVDEVLWQPMQLIGELDKYLLHNKDKDGKKIPSKEWAKLRRQLSFLYGLVRLASAAEAMGRVGSDAMAKIMNMRVTVPMDQNELTKREQYRMLVKMVKQIHSGKALEDKHRVRMALNFGVLQLSDHEIDGLIERNKV